MQQNQAVEMLSVPERSYSRGEVWVDLGCGTGTFTLALAHLLGQNSRIIAVDKEISSLEKIPGHFNGIVIEKRHADFIKDEFSFPDLDGILMANSLHYVKSQRAFIEKVKQFLKPDGCFIIVEYDTTISNPWVPYPLNFMRLTALFKAVNFSSIRKIKEKPSLYNRSYMYSAIIEKNKQ